MKYCPVVPPLAWRELERFVGREDVGMFCYADAAQINDDYAYFMRKQPYVVLDCPIMEKGRILEPRELRLLVDLIQPTFTIVPDIIFDQRGTMNLFYQYCEVIAHPSLTGVLQGETHLQLIQCACEMYNYGVRQLAIPRISDRNGAVQRSEILPELHAVFPDVKWHMLGANYPYGDEILIRNIASSCDSAEAANASIKDEPIERGQTKRSPDFMKYMELGRYFEGNVDVLAGLFKND